MTLLKTSLNDFTQLNFQYYPGILSVRPYHSNDTQKTDALQAPTTKGEPGNYEKTESVKPLDVDRSDEDSSPAMELPGLSSKDS